MNGRPDRRNKAAFSIPSLVAELYVALNTVFMSEQ